jgi:hypothetical protein
MKRLRWIVALAVVAPVAAPFADKTMTAGELPAAVGATVAREGAGRMIGTITKDGSLYRVELVTTLIVSADGKVVSGGTRGVALDDRALVPEPPPPPKVYEGPDYNSLFQGHILP